MLMPSSTSQKLPESMDYRFLFDNYAGVLCHGLPVAVCVLYGICIPVDAITVAHARDWFNL